MDRIEFDKRIGNPLSEAISEALSGFWTEFEGHCENPILAADAMVGAAIDAAVTEAERQLKK